MGHMLLATHGECLDGPLERPTCLKLNQRREGGPCRAYRTLLSAAGPFVGRVRVASPTVLCRFDYRSRPLTELLQPSNWVLRFRGPWVSAREENKPPGSWLVRSQLALRRAHLRSSF